VNKPAVEVSKAPARSASGAPMRSNAKWHPVAKRWFDSLARSGQSLYYVESDWATAYVLAESMSREFKAQPMVVDDEIVMVELPPKAASVAAWLKGMTALLATEGDRRRAALELQKPLAPAEGDGDVEWFADARKRLRGAG
jgi:hypothetical protein